ncbi:MAG: hypothetical protein AB7D39_04305 [Pseudodesulfovibrio sp.]|uniref:hypothetical protein n=1 Tax=Pseudodesulfovibrio sp. TaxID=2035812 RepID=UPI003D145FBC
MKVSLDGAYADPTFVEHEMMTSPEPPGAIGYIMDTIALEGGFVRRRREAVTYWMTMRQQSDFDVKAASRLVVAHNQNKMEREMGLLRR